MDFGTCGPALDHFPVALWNRLAARRARLADPALLGGGDAGGHAPLREAIAAYLGAARGVRCRPVQVIVTTSTRQSLDLATRLLLEPGDRAWMEDPGYRCARATLAGNRVRAVPVPVDEHGLNVALGKRRAPRARFAYVTPSHQYPLGVTLSLERRLELLRWAEGAGAWVFEDDYDSEYRYEGRPLAALQGLDTAGQVLYAGTFHKVLFPGLRLAYLVVPEVLVNAFRAAREATDGGCPPLTQAVLADFLAQGHFATHLRQMRALYRQRRDALRRALITVPGLADRWCLGSTEAGLHLTARLPSGVSDERVSDLAAGLGFGVSALSSYYADAEAAQSGLIFHYAALSPERITRGIARLGKALVEG
jgi:GntR family transcriptional regulator/MocR family aminotransferase